MKIGGIEVPKDLNVELVPLIRGDKTFMLKVQTVTDHDEREKLLPEPKAPEILKPGGKKVIDLHNAEYVKAVSTLNEKRSAWTVLKALEPSEIEWATVDMSDPDTWTNWEKEMRDYGCTDADIGRIYNAVACVQGLSQDNIEKAREDFLASKAEEEAGATS